MHVRILCEIVLLFFLHSWVSFSTPDWPHSQVAAVYLTTIGVCAGGVYQPFGSFRQVLLLSRKWPGTGRGVLVTTWSEGPLPGCTHHWGPLTGEK